MRRHIVMLMFLAAVVLLARSSSTFPSTPVPKRAVRPIAPVVSLTLSRHAGHAADPQRIGLTVDGTTNPGAISDERAYDLFLVAMANAKSAKTVDVALGPAGFSPSDKAAFLGALGSLRFELATVAAQQRPAADRLQQRRLILDNVRGRVQGSLSSEAQAKLDRYVRSEVKTRIRTYGGPMPMLNGGAQ